MKVIGLAVFGLDAGPGAVRLQAHAVFVSPDSMVGRDFEAGLANLRPAAER